MERHDVWQWFSLAVLWFCHNLNEVMAAVLTTMNIIWVGVRIFDWCIKKRQDRKA